MMHTWIWIGIGVVVGILAAGMVASVLGHRRKTAAHVSPIADELSGLARMTYRRARRLVILIVGTTIMLIGAALLLLPGPGTVVLFLGLALLATEFVWARILLKRAGDETSRLALWLKKVGSTVRARIRGEALDEDQERLM